MVRFECITRLLNRLYKMSPTHPPHLAKGSTQPPKVEGKLRLYSMNFCPFAQRARLILIAKGVPHDIVNLNLFDKPDWMFTLNPKGQVPILDTGSQIVTESTDISDFLDKEYPNPPLFSQDEAKNQADKELIQYYGANLIPKYYQAAWKETEDKTLNEYVNDMLPHLEKFEAELGKRGKFFGGQEPKMLDYMLWPWAERAGVLELVFDQKLLLDESKLPNIFNWCKEMRQTEPVKQTITSTERLYKVTLFHHPGAVIDYDGI